MQWSESGIVLGVKRHGETSVILEVMTAGHGRHLGLIRGGRSRRMQPMLQPGNTLALTWYARLSDHLGTFQAEAETLRAAYLMEGASGIYGLQTLAAHMRLLPERDPHPHLYEIFSTILDHLNDPLMAGELLVRFEVLLLDHLGFGLDLRTCVASGVTHDLIWVSPKSGCAVSRLAGQPYEKKMLPLPAFLNDKDRSNDRFDHHAILQGFRLTGYFLDRHIWTPRGIRPPDAREGLMAVLRK